MNKKELEMRTRNLHSDYEMKERLDHGLGLWPVHKKSGRICDCEMKWDKEGTTLSCPVCGLDGT